MSENTALIDVKDLVCGYGEKEIIKRISFSVKPQGRLAVIGPNGAGKSTLVKVVAGMLRATGGSVLVNGKNIHGYSSKNRAKMIAYVPQKAENQIPYTVYDFVMLGRYCVMGMLSVATETDHAAVKEALSICDVSHLSERLMYTLSGGELQRVFLAGAVAQSSPILLLDEPTTYLDPAHDRLFFDALGRLHEKRELTVVMITHDINNAIFQCSDVLALKDGSVVFNGTTDEFRNLCPSVLSEIFTIPFSKFTCRDTGEEVFGSWGRS